MPVGCIVQNIIVDFVGIRAYDIHTSKHNVLEFRFASVKNR